MQNEIELKIMLENDKIPTIQKWLEQQQIIKYQSMQLANTYFDTDECFFAQQQMGLRVRTCDKRSEMTLKMQGKIIGGLHIRPEYNLALSDDTPDFTRLVSHYSLPFNEANQIAEQLKATFRTDFHRQTWLITFQQSEIEIALDQGQITNPDGEEHICELEFELTEGHITDLFDFLDIFPLTNGMWLSSLSKAQRGYLVGRPTEIAKEIEKLTAYDWAALAEVEKYRFSQQVADFLRIQPTHPELLICFKQLNPACSEDVLDYLRSRSYLVQNLVLLKAYAKG